MTGLSRDILKWLQSLDLSYSIKSVKRDFSNGFLVAEIFSRYFPQDLQMHSFDNGTGLVKKLANWELLERFFKKRNVPIPRAAIDGVIHSKDGAAVPMLETIYTCLTNKKVISVRPRGDDDLIPPFARATASQLIKENIKDSELTSTLADETETTHRAKQLLDSHKESLKHEKNSDPSRFSVNRAGSDTAKKTQPQNRPMPSAQVMQQTTINFKEVQVRTLDRNIAQIRANKHATMSARSDVTGDYNGSPAGVAATPQQSYLQTQYVGGEEISPGNGSVAGGGMGGGIMLTAATTSLTTLVNDMIQSQLGGRAEMRLLDGKPQMCVTLIDNIIQERFKQSVAVALLDRMTEDAAQIAEACSASPKDFYRLISWFSPLLSRTDFQDLADRLIRLLSQVGTEMRNHDAFHACSVFCDFALVKIASPLRNIAVRRPALLALFYDFVEPERRMQAIKSLKDAIDDMNVFTLCLAILLGLEGDLDSSLMDMYVYYAVLGLGSESPALRACSVSMLADIATRDPALVLTLIPRLEELAEDSWWEVSAQLIVLLCRLIEFVPKDDPETLQSVCEMLTIIISNNRSPIVYKVGVSQLAGLMWNFPAVRDPLRLCALRLTEREVHDIVTGTGFGLDSGMRGANTRGSYPIPERMGIVSSKVGYFEQMKTPLRVAEALAAKVNEVGLENIELEHLALLMVCTEEPIESDDLGEWQMVLVGLKDHLYVALCDEQLCHIAARCAYKIIMALAEMSFETFTAFASSLVFVFQGESDVCREHALKLLNDIGVAGEPFTTAMQELAVKCQSLWDTELQPWLKKNGIKGPAVAKTDGLDDDH